jgi:hypothetical protein
VATSSLVPAEAIAYIDVAPSQMVGRVGRPDPLPRARRRQPGALMGSNMHAAGGAAAGHASRRSWPPAWSATSPPTPGCIVRAAEGHGDLLRRRTNRGIALRCCRR